jgi:hypothetical protein
VTVVVAAAVIATVAAGVVTIAAASGLDVAVDDVVGTGAGVVTGVIVDEVPELLVHPPTKMTMIHIRMSEIMDFCIFP